MRNVEKFSEGKKKKSSLGNKDLRVKGPVGLQLLGQELG